MKTLRDTRPLPVYNPKTYTIRKRQSVSAKKEIFALLNALILLKQSKDVVNQGNAVSNQIVVSYSPTTPTIAFTGQDFLTGADVPVVITFDQDVTGLTLSDFTVGFC